MPVGCWRFWKNCDTVFKSRALWSKARHFHAKTNKMGSTKWIYHKERNFAASFFTFLRTKFAYKNKLIKCTNNLNILFDTFREFLSFIRVCVFSVSIFKVTQVTLLLLGGQVLKKRLNHLWVFCEKGVLKSFKKYTGNDLYRSPFLIKVQGFSL